VKFKKLDRRMTGYGQFTHVADFAYGKDDRINFILARRWCEEQWGETVEFDFWTDYDEFKNPAWTWERGEFNKTYRCRIFFVSEKEASWFALKWC
jgi:hypothetical protein